MEVQGFDGGGTHRTSPGKDGDSYLGQGKNTKAVSTRAEEVNTEATKANTEALWMPAPMEMGSSDVA